MFGDGDGESRGGGSVGGGGRGYSEGLKGQAFIDGPGILITMEGLAL